MHELEFLSTFYCLLNFSNLDDDLDMISLLQFLEWVDELLRIFAYYLSLGFCASAYVIIIISSLGCVDLTVLFHLPSSFSMCYCDHQTVAAWLPACLAAAYQLLSASFCFFLQSLLCLFKFSIISIFTSGALLSCVKRREEREGERCRDASLLFYSHSIPNVVLSFSSLFDNHNLPLLLPASTDFVFIFYHFFCGLSTIDSVTQSIQHSAIQWLCCPPSSIQFSISFAWFAVASLVHSSGDFLFLRTRMHICHCQIIKSISLHLTVIVIPALNLDCYHWFPHCPPPPFFFPFLPLPVTIHLPLSLSWTNTLTDIQKCRNVGIIAVYLGSETEECSYSCKQYAFWQRCDLWYPFDLCK